MPVKRIHPPAGGGSGGGPGGSTIVVPGVINADTLAGVIADAAPDTCTRDGGTNVTSAGITGFRVKMLAGTLGTYPVVMWEGAGLRELIRANLTFDALNEELSVRVVGPAPGIAFFDTLSVVIENGPDATATFDVTPYLLEQGA